MKKIMSYLEHLKQGTPLGKTILMFVLRMPLLSYIFVLLTILILTCHQLSSEGSGIFLSLTNDNSFIACKKEGGSIYCSVSILFVCFQSLALYLTLTISALLTGLYYWLQTPLKRDQGYKYQYIAMFGGITSAICVFWLLFKLGNVQVYDFVVLLDDFLNRRFNTKNAIYSVVIFPCALSAIISAWLVERHIKKSLVVSLPTTNT